MSRNLLDRRQFLTLPVALVLAPLAARAEPGPAGLSGSYGVEVGIFYDVFSLQLPGRLEGSVDGAAGHYAVLAAGRGRRIANRIESRGVLRQGRWAPLQTTSWFEVMGREARTDIRYDYSRRLVAYRHRSETFFRRRQRAVDDVVRIPEGAHVDDAVSAVLNYADRRWPAEPDGRLRTHLVRRHRPEREGPDDVAAAYHAEIVPLTLALEVDSRTGQRRALLDLTGFSSWASADRPARIVFGPDRRPQEITASLILGSSVRIRFEGMA